MACTLTPPALRKVLLPTVTVPKEGASSFGVNYSMTGETNLPTGIIDFLGIKKFVNPSLGQFREPSRKALICWASRIAFGGDTSLLRVRRVAVISRFDICFP